MTCKIRIEEARREFERILELCEPAWRSDCTCGSDPEGSCPFCSKMERIDNGLTRLTELLTLQVDE